MERYARTAVLLDTNVLVSAFVFGGKPQELLRLVIGKQIKGVISPPLIMELTGVLFGKFRFDTANLVLLEKKIRKYFQCVYPSKTIKVLRDDPDNRVLEAALAGNCAYIITGDKELLALRRFKRVVITTPAKFLEILRTA